MKKSELKPLKEKVKKKKLDHENDFICARNSIKIYLFFFLYNYTNIFSITSVNLIIIFLFNYNILFNIK